MKLKAIIEELLLEWVSHGIAVNRNPDSKLHPTPGGWNDNSPNWNGIIKGPKNEWFAYLESNDWENKRSGATVYITEDDKSHKIWIKIKTGGLRKKNDTNESYKERVRKHTNKVAHSWMSAAKKIHNNPEINEIGNTIPITWKEAFRESMNDPKVKEFLVEYGEKEMTPILQESKW